MGDEISTMPALLAGARLPLVLLHGSVEARLPPQTEGGALVLEAAARVWPTAPAPEPELSVLHGPWTGGGA
jgi:hypothetical protein